MWVVGRVVVWKYGGLLVGFDVPPRTIKGRGARSGSAITIKASQGPKHGLSLSLTTHRRRHTTVFVAGKPIGGGDDTAALSASGKLKPLLKEAGAL